MIKVTRLNGLEIIINADLIEVIESTPDTVLTLTTGNKYVVRDSVEEIIQKVVAYQRQKSAGPLGFAKSCADGEN